MSIPRPHFLLFSDATRPARRGRSAEHGAWRFVLEELDGATRLEAEEAEDESSGDRLELLAVVRGLEALDQPSRVTLVTSSRYVARGLRHGLREWRENDWQWERFGQMAPVRNVDLWRRIDRALEFHQIECRTVGNRDAQRWDVAPLDEPRSAAEVPVPVRGERAASRSAPWWQRRLAPCLRALQATTAPLARMARAVPSHAG